MKKFLLIVIVFLLVGCSFGDNVETSDNEYIELLELYISNEVHDYIFQSYSDSNTGELVLLDELSNDVVQSLILLEDKVEYDLNTILDKSGSSLEKVKNYYLSKKIDEEVSIYEAYNIILVKQLLNLDLEDEITYFNNLVFDDLGTYDYITAIKCFNLLNIENELKNQLETLYSDIPTGYVDADLIAMIVTALEGDVNEDYVTYLENCITDDGVNNYSGTPSCSSTSQVIIAMYFLELENDLFDSLLEFRVTDGFKEYLSDSQRNESYASPQAFLAITYLSL